MIVMATMWLRIAGPTRLNRQPVRKLEEQFSTLQEDRNIQLGMFDDVANALEEIESEDVVHGAKVSQLNYSAFLELLQLGK